MHQVVCKRTVVGQDQETLSHQVQAADGKDSGRWRNEVQDGLATFWIRCRRHDPRGLVEEVVDEALGDGRQDAIDLYTDLIWHDSVSNGGTSAIDGDPTIDDELLAVATTSDASPSKHLLEPLGSVVARHVDGASASSSARRVASSSSGKSVSGLGS